MGAENLLFGVWKRNLSCHIYDVSKWHVFLYILALDLLKGKSRMFFSSLVLSSTPQIPVQLLSKHPSTVIDYIRDMLNSGLL